MKYFGKGSLSSVISVLLSISWYVVLVCSVVCIAFMAVILLNPAAQQFVGQQIEKEHPAVNGVPSEDMKDWQEFMKLPTIAKVFMFPFATAYVAAVVVVLLMVIKKSKQVFENFRNEIVFDKGNVEIMTAANKLTIVFSIITFNFSGLLTCLMFFMLIEIFKNGAKLQEEHDLTV